MYVLNFDFKTAHVHEDIFRFKLKGEYLLHLHVQFNNMGQYFRSTDADNSCPDQRVRSYSSYQNLKYLI